jgi:hypothetical protein
MAESAPPLFPLDAIVQTLRPEHAGCLTDEQKLGTQQSLGWINANLKRVEGLVDSIALAHLLRRMADTIQRNM